MTQTLLVTEEVAASALRSTSSNSTAMASEGSRTIEAYVIITAESSGDFDFNLQTSIDGTNWVTQKTNANVVDIGTISLAIARGNDEALGIQARVAWTRNGGSFTFSVIMGSFE